MQDRQSEVLAAIDVIQHTYHFTAKNTGLMGFSQAGWVLPALANKTSKVGFVIGVGFATNWVDQGRYATKVRHQLAGSHEAKANSAVAAYNKEVQYFHEAPSYSAYSKSAGKYAMGKERYQFVLANFKVDARFDYSNIKVPTLLLWGKDDLNVEAKKEFKWWQAKTNTLVETKLIDGAGHALLNSSSFDSQNIGFRQWVKLMWLGREAFSPDFFPILLAWLEQRNL